MHKRRALAASAILSGILSATTATPAMAYPSETPTHFPTGQPAQGMMSEPVGSVPVPGSDGHTLPIFNSVFDAEMHPSEDLESANFCTVGEVRQYKKAGEGGQVVLKPRESEVSVVQGGTGVVYRDPKGRQYIGEWNSATGQYIDWYAMDDVVTYQLASDYAEHIALTGEVTFYESPCATEPWGVDVVEPVSAEDRAQMGLSWDHFGPVTIGGEDWYKNYDDEWVRLSDMTEDQVMVTRSAEDIAVEKAAEVTADEKREAEEAEQQALAEAEQAELDRRLGEAEVIDSEAIQAAQESSGDDPYAAAGTAKPGSRPAIVWTIGGILAAALAGLTVYLRLRRKKSAAPTSSTTGASTPL